MSLKKVPARPIFLAYQCDYCESFVEAIGLSYMSGKYQHKCTNANCGAVVELDETFPKQTWEPILDQPEADQ